MNTKSYWIESVKGKNKEFSSLEKDEKVDVCIIGGGLTGLTTAYYLSKTNLKVALLEKNRICEHTSGNTTAKITSQHGLFYDYLIQSQGKEKAKQYLEANEQAISNIEKIVEDESINCDLERTDSYVYTLKQEELEKIKKEVDAVNSLGFTAKFISNVELPFRTLGAIRFQNQAEFNPCKYALGLVKAMEGKENITIYEKTKVVDLKGTNIESNIDEKISNIEASEAMKMEKAGLIQVSNIPNAEGYNIITENGKTVTAKYVVLASHYPIINVPGYYFLKMYQEMSYLIGLETSAQLPKGMYITAENPTVSFRVAKENGKSLLLIGGIGHKTGERKDISDSYAKLEAIAKQYYPDCNIKYHWCTEDCISLDKIPYIGEFSNLMPNVYVGTGYKKWGMTTSNVAANIIVDKILGKENPYEDVFTSTRLKPIKNYQELGNMIKEVANSWTVEKLKVSNEKIQDIAPGTGGLIEYEDKKVGVYREENGKVYMVKPVCSHLGCELTWNNLERTWDCPCHGSRFTYKGKSIYDPSIKDLEVVEMET